MNDNSRDYNGFLINLVYNLVYCFEFMIMRFLAGDMKIFGNWCAIDAVYTVDKFDQCTSSISLFSLLKF